MRLVVVSFLTFCLLIYKEYVNLFYINYTILINSMNMYTCPNAINPCRAFNLKFLHFHKIN